MLWANYPDEPKSVTKDNEKQAEVIKEQYEEKYDSECYVYKVKTAADFVNTWNSLDDSEPIDAIQFIGHGTAARELDEINYGYGNIYFGDGSKLYADSYINNIAGEIFDRTRRIKGINDYTIDDVQSKNVGCIYFSACNTANQDFTANIAEAFYNKNPQAQTVSGWDGGVTFRFHQRGLRSIFSGNFKWTANKDFAMDMNDQTTFKTFMDRTGNTRNPGLVTYDRKSGSILFGNSGSHGGSGSKF